jgi:hypothetical protein
MENATVVQSEPTVVALTALITVIAPYTGDDNSNNFCRLWWKVAGSGTWLEAFPMYDDRVNKRWQGVIYDLQPFTEYEVMVEFSDPDNPGGIVLWTRVVKTKSDTSPVGNGPTYVVSPSGDDTWTGSEGNPWRNINRAIPAMAPGVTVLVRGDASTPYLEQVNFYYDAKPTWGDPANPMTIKAYPGDTPVIDGQGIRANGILLNRYARVLKNVVLGGLAVRNTLGSNIYGYGETPYKVLGLTVEDCLLENPGRATGVDGNIEMMGQGLIARRTIMRAPGASILTCNIKFWRITDGLHSVYDCILDGGYDNIGTGGEQTLNEGIGRDSEFYRLQMLNAADDTFQFDGSSARVVAWRNRGVDPGVRGVGSHLSAGPMRNGPAYSFRNLWIETRAVPLCPAVKTGGNSYGKLYVVHNTFLNVSTGISNWAGSGGWTNQEYYCNIIKVGGPKYALEGVPLTGNVYNYNLYWVPKFVNGFAKSQSGGYYRTLADWQAASGQDLQSIYADPMVDPSTGQLLPGSPAVDRGAFWPGWSEPYQGVAPDIGAFESDETAQTYTLTVTAVGNGTTQPAGTQPFFQGSNVSVQATAALGSKFDHWEGDVPAGLETQNPLPLTMDSNKAVVAVFVGLPAYLTLAVEGSGTVSPEPGILPFPKGTRVDLVATAAQGWAFQGWTGSLVSPNRQESVVMDADMSITAVFVRITFTIMILQGEGGNTIPAAGVFPLNEGDYYSIQAIANGGYQFREWREGGVFIGTTNPLTGYAQRDMEVLPVFEVVVVPPGQHAVTITVVGAGSTYPYPPGVYPVEDGALFGVEARASPGSRFVRWEINGSVSTEATLVVQVNAALSIVAVFEPIPPAPSKGGWVFASFLVGTLIAAAVRGRRKR